MWEVRDTSPETTNMVYAYPELCQLVVFNERTFACYDYYIGWKLTISFFDLANGLEPEIVDADRLDPPPWVCECHGSVCFFAFSTLQHTNYEAA